MRIAEEIAHVEREFISGELLLAAMVQQEGVPEYQVASWFVRNIKRLDRRTMFSFHSGRRDFRIVEVPWSLEIFNPLAGGYASYSSWDADEDGYVGGWLSTDLKSFFSETQVDFPEPVIRELRKNEAPLNTIFEETIQIDSEVAEPNLATRERSSLLTIIAALAVEANIAIITPSKAADLISDMTQKMGTPVSKRAIEEHLKRIPDALERRMK